jgi:hypothetical protein
MTEAKIKRLRQTAYHEAGHAVAALHFGQPIVSAAIWPTGGVCVNDNPPRRKDQTELDYCGRCVVITMAGVEAEARHLGSWDKVGFTYAGIKSPLTPGSADRQEINRIGEGLFPGWRKRVQRLAWLSGLRKQTARIIEGDWAAVAAIAAALVRRSSLTGEEVRRVYDLALKRMEKMAW